MKIGILTGGGDCPGLNAVIRGAVFSAKKHGWEVVGIKNGWAGMMKMDAKPLTIEGVQHIITKGGTIIGTSRTNPFKAPDGPAKVQENMKKMGLDALIAIGGDDTLGVASKLAKLGVHVVGVPKTIDNDLCCTEYTFGFDTAVNTAMEAIDRIRDTAESHDRSIVVEVMGRHAGWIAAYAGIAGGADYITVPEEPFDIEDICKAIREQRKRGKNYSIIVVSEGSVPKEGTINVESGKETDDFGHVHLGGIGNAVAQEIEKRTGMQTRCDILGYIQRGGTPSAFDRVLSTRFGIRAVELVRDGAWGKMVALQANRIVAVPLEDAVGKLKLLDMETYNASKIFFG